MAGLILWNVVASESMVQMTWLISRKRKSTLNCIRCISNNTGICKQEPDSERFLIWSGKQWRSVGTSWRQCRWQRSLTYLMIAQKIRGRNFLNKRHICQDLSLN
ncbi:hypothetical protein L596_015789 [Steinernema carpocapsae]|nr:hypothetical protein L596_015789 [Steinernema carpocapsae]